MFTGILQGTAEVKQLVKTQGLYTFTLALPEAFCEGLFIGASVSADGVCLTVTRIPDATHAEFDVILQSLEVTALKFIEAGTRVNVERAVKDGAEVGGHAVSGHVDYCAELLEIQQPEGNHMLRLSIPEPWRKYFFAKGFVAVNGASLTVSHVNRQEGWFEIWLIPETLRVTNLGDKKVGEFLNVEIDRGTQVVVDTLRAVIEENLDRLAPALSGAVDALPDRKEQLVAQLVSGTGQQRSKQSEIPYQTGR